MNDKIHIDHGIFDTCGARTRKGDNYIPLPLRIADYLLEKHFKFNKPIEFTVGSIPDKHIVVAAVCHPLDQFSRKIGVKIVSGRIKRALGEIQGRAKYNPTPKWLYILNGND